MAVRTRAKTVDLSSMRLWAALASLENKITDMLTSWAPIPLGVVGLHAKKINGKKAYFLILDHGTEAGLTMVPIAKEYANALIKAGMDSGS